MQRVILIPFNSKYHHLWVLEIYSLVNFLLNSLLHRHSAMTSFCLHKKSCPNIRLIIPDNLKQKYQSEGELWKFKLSWCNKLTLEVNSGPPSVLCLCLKTVSEIGNFLTVPYIFVPKVQKGIDIGKKSTKFWKLYVAGWKIDLEMDEHSLTMISLLLTKSSIHRRSVHKIATRQVVKLHLASMLLHKQTSIWLYLSRQLCYMGVR